MPSNGINRRTGKLLTDLDHVRQSVEVIFTTHIGSRVMRRTFGSAVPPLLMRQNLTAEALALFFFAIKVAIDLWEPRLLVQQVLYPVPANSSNRFRIGQVQFRVRAIYRPYATSGDFTTDSSGRLVTTGGQQVMGYAAPGGVINPNGSLQALNVGAGTTTPANPTSRFSLTTNLDSTSAVGATFNSPLSVYDSLGAAHDLTITYTKTGNNTWSYNATLPSTDIQGGTGTTTSVGSGTFTFDSTGALTSPTSPVSLAIGPLSDGAASLNPTWNLTNSNGVSLLTQTASTAGNSAKSQDGFAAGTLSSFSVLTDGTVQATFTNGQNRALGQVAVASFANPEGLSMSGSNLYNLTSASGAPVIGVAGTGGRGAIVGSTVESSNVDVAKEFAQLIVAQRSYEANSKAITAFDQVEQATIAMKN